MKNIKFLGNYGIFFIGVSLILAMTILFFNYSIITGLQPSISAYSVPLWIDILSAICMNLAGIIMALIFIKVLRDMIKTNKHQAQKQKVK